MDKKKIIIVTIIIAAAAAAYYFYTVGSRVEEPAPQKNSVGPNDLNYEEPVVTDPNAGKQIMQSSGKDIAKYYSKNFPENPFLNPIILPGFLLTRLKKKKK